MTVITNPAEHVIDPGAGQSIADPTAIFNQANPALSTGSPHDIPVPIVNNSHDRIQHTSALVTVEPPDSSGVCHLYDDEKNSDVTLLVGINGDTCRYPCHRKVLESDNPVFTDMFAEKTKDVYVIDYVDRRGFEQLLRYIYKRPVQLSSAVTARSTLDAGYKFLRPGLVELCVKRLDELLDPETALATMRDLRYLCTKLPGIPSAPPVISLMDVRPFALMTYCSDWCDSLARNVLLYIDENADRVLQHELFEEIQYEDVALIVKRDTLRISSELVLAEALSRWSTATCKRLKRELTSENKQLVLGELIYTIRFLLLEGEELEKAFKLELLKPLERVFVMCRSRNVPPPTQPTAEQESLLRQWARPRPTEPAAIPVWLSKRSEPSEPEPSTTFCGCKRKRPKPSPLKEAELSPKKGCCACFGESMLRAFICLFD